MCSRTRQATQMFMTASKCLGCMHRDSWSNKQPMKITRDKPSFLPQRAQQSIAWPDEGLAPMIFVSCLSVRASALVKDSAAQQSRLIKILSLLLGPLPWVPTYVDLVCMFAARLLAWKVHVLQRPAQRIPPKDVEMCLGWTKHLASINPARSGTCFSA